MTTDLSRITTIEYGAPGAAGAGITSSEKVAFDARLTSLENGLGFFINADDYADLNDAITASVTAGGLPVWVPTARTQTTPVSIPTGLQSGFRMWGLGEAAPITYSGAGAFFTTDTTGTPTNLTQRSHWELRNLSIIGPGSGSAGSIGLKIVNSAVGHLFDVRINGFETGVLYDGLNAANSATCYYNDAYHLRVRQCKDAVVLQNGANSNTFHGGSWVSSERGLVITNCNAVDLFGIDIESNTVYGAYLDCTKCRIFGGRFENPSATKEVIFYDGNGRGTGNVINAYFSEVAIDGAITWDTNRDNLVSESGYLNLGSSDATANGFVIKGKRTVASDAEPFMDIADTYSPSGTPIGYQYASVRANSIGFLMYKDDGAGNLYPIIQLSHAASGKPHLTFGDTVSVAQDTNIYRDSPDVLKTDDALVVADALTVKTKAGAVIDGDFLHTPPNGTIAIDVTNSKIYVRIGNVWKATAALT